MTLKDLDDTLTRYANKDDVEKQSNEIKTQLQNFRILFEKKIQDIKKLIATEDTLQQAQQ